MAQDGRESRVERYLALGFGEAGANLLADAKWVERDKKGRPVTTPLYWGRVRAALERGCSHETALAIYL